MIVNTARVTIRPEKRTEFFQTITELLEPIKMAQGCMGFHFYVDTSDENSSLLLGEWETESDLENHLRSNDFAILRGAITVLCSQGDEFRALIYEAAGRKNGAARGGMTRIS
ncbi:MAG TPA: antibiotic biosynthesis monooxygenase family protein [Pyrinomonadaceae bacterium]|nr:antibiotic biosynthesis monooxygenase family protein [Pyrinomonadaceae bacterium]